MLPQRPIPRPGDVVNLADGFSTYFAERIRPTTSESIQLKADPVDHTEERERPVRHRGGSEAPGRLSPCTRTTQPRHYPPMIAHGRANTAAGRSSRPSLALHSAALAS